VLSTEAQEARRNMVFRGTRLPVAALFEHLDQGSTIDEFLEWFPSVSREQVTTFLRLPRVPWISRGGRVKIRLDELGWQVIGGRPTEQLESRRPYSSAWAHL